MQITHGLFYPDDDIYVENWLYPRLLPFLALYILFYFFSEYYEKMC